MPVLAVYVNAFYALVSKKNHLAIAGYFYPHQLIGSLFCPLFRAGFFMGRKPALVNPVGSFADSRTDLVFLFSYYQIKTRLSNGAI